jgi:signal transduction histidine kinase
MNPQVQSDRLSLASLPALRDPSAGGSPGGDSVRRGRRPPTAKKEILLVEDDRAIREAVQEILEDEGYAVSMAENGLAALEGLRAGAIPDLIVLDLRMPVMDGWQFRAAQKGDASIADIPVVAISADGSAKAEAIDAHAYLRKPLSPEALLDAVSRIMANLEREELLGRLEEAERFAALGRLAASVGHEVNNPLAYVSMNIELMTDQIGAALERAYPGAPSPVDLESLLTMMRECRVGLDRIRDVVKDLQRLSRTSQAKREPFSMNELLDESLAIARNHVEHRASVRKQYGALPPAVGDRSAMGQVLLNLILNAAQALPEGRADANEITLRTFVAGEEITVEIRDTGAGIAPEVMPHIFDPFYTTKRIGEGTGLGLAVSCRIVADHGGRIDVDSELGRGSAFRVVLPALEPAADPGAEDVTPAPAISSTRARVLVIDDVPAVGQTVAAALADEHDVTVVTRATEAFALLAANQTFDVILCDLLMPKLGGREVFERLTAEWPHLAPNVVFMTGGAFTAESREFVGRAGQRVLAKPFRIDELRAVVQAQLAERARGRN